MEHSRAVLPVACHHREPLRMWPESCAGPSSWCELSLVPADTFDLGQRGRAVAPGGAGNAVHMLQSRICGESAAYFC